MAIVVNNLASNYTAQDKYPEAEKCVKEGLEFLEQSKKGNDKTVASLVEALATVYLAQNRIDEAEAAYRRELAVLTKQSASPSLATANAFNGLADVHYRLGRFQEAETEKTQAMEIAEKAVGANVILDWARADLALIQYAQSHGARAESLFQESLDSMKKASGNEESRGSENLSKQIADRLERLAELYGGEGKNEQSASLYKEALEIREKDIGRNDRRTIATTKTYVGVLRKLKRDAEADELDARLKGVPK